VCLLQKRQSMLLVGLPMPHAVGSASALLTPAAAAAAPGSISSAASGTWAETETQLQYACVLEAPDIAFCGQWLQLCRSHAVHALPCAYCSYTSCLWPPRVLHGLLPLLLLRQAPSVAAASGTWAAVLVAFTERFQPSDHVF
jgi:hypothetical protein